MREQDRKTLGRKVQGRVVNGHLGTHFDILDRKSPWSIWKDRE